MATNVNAICFSEGVWGGTGTLGTLSPQSDHLILKTHRFFDMHPEFFHQGNLVSEWKLPKKFLPNALRWSSVMGYTPFVLLFLPKYDPYKKFRDNLNHCQCSLKKKLWGILASKDRLPGKELRSLVVLEDVFFLFGGKMWALSKIVICHKKGIILPNFSGINQFFGWEQFFWGNMSLGKSPFWPCGL